MSVSPARHDSRPEETGNSSKALIIAFLHYHVRIGLFFLLFLLASGAALSDSAGSGGGGIFILVAFVFDAPMLLFAWLLGLTPIEMTLPLVLLLGVFSSLIYGYTLARLAEEYRTDTSPKRSQESKRWLTSPTAVVLAVTFILVVAESIRQMARPMGFIGKVIDQNDQPVAGAKVEFQSQGWVGVNKRATISGDDGVFVLKRWPGDGFSISLQKADYFTSRQNQSHFKNADDPKLRDSNSPLLFRVYRKLPTEPLKSQMQFLDIPTDDKPFGYDPVAFQKNTNGPIFFRLATEPPIDQRSDCRLRISVIGGGIQKAEGEFPFVAPEDGYQLNVDCSVQREGPGNGQFQFFFFLEQPRLYGRVRFELGTYSRPQEGKYRLPLDIWVNPSGSRNLQGEPERFGF